MSAKIPTAERRELVKRAFVDSGGKPDVSELSLKFGVSVSTIYADLQKFRDIIQKYPETATTEADRLASARWYGELRDKMAAMMDDANISRHHNARVGYARVALEAEKARVRLLGLEAPAKVEQSGVMRVVVEVGDGVQRTHDLPVIEERVL